MSSLTETSRFFTHLRTHLPSHVLLTGETEDFDPATLSAWSAEGFKVTYIPHISPQSAYISSIKRTADAVVGVSERYAIVCFEDAATNVLERLQNGLPRLLAIVAYYPSAIPEPAKTSFPPDVSVLVHLCGEQNVGVRHKAEILGIQGKMQTRKKRVERGRGLGGGMEVGRRHGLGDGVGEGGMKVYVYPGTESGFAESDLDEFNPVACELAWGRSLGVVRDALGVRVDVEGVRDGFVDEVKKNVEGAVGEMGEGAKVLCTPTMMGGVDDDGLENFYEDFFNPTQHLVSRRLISRTLGPNQVVDEVLVNFVHTEVMPWILPNIPPTKNRVEIVIISIVVVKGGRIFSERMYWDQASVLAQIGLLDPKMMPKQWKDKGVKTLPVVGAKAARAVTSGPEDDVEVNKLADGVKKM